MIWLGIYAAGVVVGLVLHGIYGSWQDDTLGILNAAIWPLFIPYVLLVAPIKLARFVAENWPASAIEARSDATVKQGAAEGESAGPKDDAHD